MKAGLLLKPMMPFTGAPAMAARVPVPKPVLNWIDPETRACMAVGPLRNSTGKTFKPSGLKKSFLSATDNGKSDRVGASMPIMTLTTSAEKLCGKFQIDNRKKLARNTNRELFPMQISFLRTERSTQTTAVESIEATISCQAARQWRRPE